MQLRNPQNSNIMQTYEEVWKDIPNYEGYYQVSNLGRVKSLSRKIESNRGFFVSKEKILKQSKDQKGYFRVKLYFNSGKKTMKVHRLVMIAFVGKLNLEVNHINGLKEDNRLANLEYVTTRQNIMHAMDIGLRVSKLTLEDAKRIKYGNDRPSVLAREYGVTITLISRIRKGLAWANA